MNKRKLYWAGRMAVSAVLLLAPAAAVRAEVVDSSALGFTTRTAATIGAPPAEVYGHLIKDIGQWWDPEHTYSRNAANLSIDGRAGGFFLERLPDGGSVLHLTVAYAAPGKALRLLGGMGPLQAMAVSGSMTWEFKAEGAGTRVDVVYAVGGYAPAGLEKMAPLVDKVLAGQLERLKAFVEKK